MEIRGEVFISKSNFKKLNDYKKNSNEPLFANARNAASGSLKLQDSSEVAKRKFLVELIKQSLKISLYDFNIFVGTIGNIQLFSVII